MEIVQQRWAGSGDKKLDSILMSLSYYTRNITEDEFINVLQSWFDSIKSSRREYKKITAPKEPERVVLNLIYMNEFTANDHLNASAYDIEHLATKGLMKRLLDKFEGNLRLPISSIGNLCLLPQRENRSKQERTIYSDTAYLKKSHLTIEDIEVRFSFTARTDLDWINDTALTESEVADAYTGFIDRRFEAIKGKITANYSSI
jgi:hypothetical protein